MIIRERLREICRVRNYQHHLVLRAFSREEMRRFVDEDDDGSFIFLFVLQEFLFFGKTWWLTR